MLRGCGKCSRLQGGETVVSYRWLVLLIPFLLLGACEREQPPAEPAAEVEITEWVVPFENSRPRDPYYENANRVWFVGQRDGYLGIFNPETEEFTRIDLPEGAGPHNVIVDDQGVAWYAENVLGFIGRIAPDGTLARIPMPDPAATDPHTLIGDGEGNIWFTVQGGNFVGRLVKATQAVDLIPVPTGLARPYGITVTPDGTPWVALFGTNKLARIDTAALILSEIELPREDARPRRIAATPHGMIWYVDYAQGYLGRYDPQSGDFAEWRAPAGEASRPYGMAADDQGRLWFVETGPSPNRLVGFDPEAESFFSLTEIDSGGGAVRHIMYHAPSGTLWFGTDTNTLVRATLP